MARNEELRRSILDNKRGIQSLHRMVLCIVVVGSLLPVIAGSIVVVYWSLLGPESPTIVAIFWGAMSVVAILLGVIFRHH